jgi:LDH2 family malate/lactate/ureidoglycolate dehydrogenase
LARYAEAELHGFAAAVLASVGTPDAHAAIVASCLVDADRRGVATHGLIRLPSYVTDVHAGRVDAAVTPWIIRDDGPTATVDGCAGFGAVTGVFAMDEAIDRAERYGAGVVTARRCNHLGALSFYSLRAAASGLVGIAATSTPAVMAPTGGSEARIGNNPLSVAAPRAAGKPLFCLDVAQSAVSRGRIKLAQLAQEPIPEGWALDATGAPTTDPTAALAGALLPIGGHKGYGLALAVEVLAGVLAGGDVGPELVNASLTGASTSSAATRTGTVGSFYLALDPNRFLDSGAFVDRVEGVVAWMTSTPPAVGASEVVVPGEPEARAEADACANGIPLNVATAEALAALGARARVGFPRRHAPRARASGPAWRTSRSG